MKQVFEEIMIAIQSLIDAIKEELDKDIDSKEREYLKELSRSLETVIYNHQEMKFEEVFSFIQIVEHVDSFGGIEGKDYSDRTKYYFKELQTLYIYIKSIRSKYAFNTILDRIQDKPIKVSDHVDMVTNEARRKRQTYDLVIGLVEDADYIDPRIDLAKMYESLFYAEENAKAFQSITTVSFTKLYLEYIISKGIKMKKMPEYGYIASTISKIVERLENVCKAPVVTADKNYYDLVFDTVSSASELLRITGFGSCELVYFMQLLLMQLNYEKYMRVQQYIKHDSLIPEGSPIDYDELIDRVNKRVQYEGNISLQSPVFKLRTNCPSYMNLDQENNNGPISIEDRVQQLKYLDRIFCSQMLLSGLIKLRKDKRKSLN